MKRAKFLMGMPVTVEIIDPGVTEEHLEKIFSYFHYIDRTFSTYKKTSEISQYNRGEILEKDLRADVRTIFRLSEQTKQETNGYFNIVRNKKIDPSGIVKGWAIYQSSLLLKKEGFENFFIEAGGDIQVSGTNKEQKPWSVGIKNPFKQDEIVKIVYVTSDGVATSGTYIRGQHVYDPHNPVDEIHDIVSLTVIGPNIYEADRFATPAFAMGKKGIQFIEKLKGFEGYMIDKDGIATMTSGFERYTVCHCEER